MGILTSDDWCSDCNKPVKVSAGRATISEQDLAIEATRVQLGKAHYDAPATLDWGTKSEGLFKALLSGFFDR